MESEKVNIDINEILKKLSRLQLDVNYIKAKLSLDEEMDLWENISTEDNVDFFKKNNL